MFSVAKLDQTKFYALHLPAGAVLVAAGTALYGWKALASIAVVLTSTLIALAIWRRIGRRGKQLNRLHCLWLALLLSLALPPTLLTTPNWPILPAAGGLLVMATWLLVPLGAGRVHPVAATYLFLIIFFEPLLVISQASERLTAYTSGWMPPDRFSVSLQMVLRDQLPPLENLILGREAGPIGAGSAAAVILGGLLLIYCGVIDWRIPLWACVAAFAAWMVLPVPVVITDTGAHWHWLVYRRHYLGWPAAVTLAEYELLACPFLFVVFFLATAGSVRPMGRQGRVLYGLSLGLLAAAAQLYGSVAVGPYGAVLVAGMMTSALDCLFPTRPLIGPIHEPA
jgi:Na+-translocating ferredoxin:NAD+ oxidoreductase RnfD subunit